MGAPRRTQLQISEPLERIAGTLTWQREVLPVLPHLGLELRLEQPHAVLAKQLVVSAQIGCNPKQEGQRWLD